MWRVIRNSILLFLMLGLALYAQNFTAKLEKRIPQGYALADNIYDSENIPATDTVVLGSFQSEGKASYQNVEQAVKIFSTVNDFDPLLGKTLLAGNFYTESIVPEENCYAVIDAELAVQLFMETDVCGRTIKINDTEYQICGVIENKNGIIERMSKELDASIYIPANSPEGDTSGNPLFWCPAIKTIQNRTSAAETFSQYGNCYVDASSVVDMNELIELNRAIANVMLLFIPFSVIVFLRSIFGNRIQRLPMQVKRTTKVIASITVVMLQLLVMVYSIPEQVLPPDNIFEIQYYLDEFISWMQIGLSAGGQMHSYISQNLYSFFFLFWLFIIANLLFVIQIKEANRRE